MSAFAIKCRKGDPCRFEIVMGEPIDADYTVAKFRVRDELVDSGEPLLAAETGDGITIDHANGIVYVELGATKTDGLPTIAKAREVVAQIRFYSLSNPDERWSLRIPFQISGDAIDD